MIIICNDSQYRSSILVQRELFPRGIMSYLSMLFYILSFWLWLINSDPDIGIPLQLYRINLETMETWINSGEWTFLGCTHCQRDCQSWQWEIHRVSQCRFADRHPWKCCVCWGCTVNKMRFSSAKPFLCRTCRTNDRIGSW